MLSTPLLIRQCLYFCVQSVRTSGSPTYYPKFIFGGFSSFPFVHFFWDDSLFHLSAKKKKRVEGCWEGRRDVLWLCDALPFDRWDHWREGGRRRRRRRREVLTGWWPEGNWPEGGRRRGGRRCLSFSLALTRSHPAGGAGGGGADQGF